MNRSSRILVLFLIFCFVSALSGIALQQTEETVTCPVSGKVMKKSEAKASWGYEEKTYYFCCQACKEKFIKEPEKYLEKKSEAKEVYTCPMHPDLRSEKPGKCPHCGMELEKKMMTQETMKCCMDMECPMMAKDVDVKIENLPDGISVRMTSKNAETVKKIQEHAAKMKAACGEKKASPKKEEIKN